MKKRKANFIVKKDFTVVLLQLTPKFHKKKLTAKKISPKLSSQPTSLWSATKVATACSVAVACSGPPEIPAKPQEIAGLKGMIRGEWPPLLRPAIS